MELLAQGFSLLWAVHCRAPRAICAGNAPAPTPTPVPTPGTDQVLLAVSVHMVSQHTAQDLLEYLQDAFKGAVVSSFASVWCVHRAGGRFLPVGECALCPLGLD